MSLAAPPEHRPQTGRRADTIVIDELTVKFGAFTAVDRLSLSVREGELFGFLGPNGAGKSTTIRVLIGTQRPSAGCVEIAGHRLPQDFARVKPLFGYVPDSENHMEEFSGRENLVLFAKLYGVPLGDVDRALARLELSEAANLPVRTYSKGMRKKLLIAREILHRPRILYLDEPTANLDRHSTDVVRKLLRELAAGGTTVFLTTHDMDEVEQICDRVAILCKGRLVECDTPVNFMTRHAEHKVLAQYDRAGEVFREMLDLDDDGQRVRLAEIVRHEDCVRMHSQEFQFEDVFLKLTGQAYS
jgi:ABC-2 type transport system ATP-binding protein